MRLEPGLPYWPKSYCNRTCGLFQCEQNETGLLLIGATAVGLFRRRLMDDSEVSRQRSLFLVDKG